MYPPLRFWLCLFLTVAAGRGWAQPKSDLAAPAPLDPVEGKKEAETLITRLLAQKPEQPATNNAVLRIRDNQGMQKVVGARFSVVPNGADWLNVYEAVTAPQTPPIVLTIIHHEGQANEYLLSGQGLDGKDSAGRKLSPDELMKPFAGSDFWVADLGLEFLHWPKQQVLRKQMRKGLFCDVLQSTNPQPTKGSYSRVVSWIAVNRPEDIVIVHAEAYDSQDKLLKEFDPKKVEKINGLWQLEEMEIRNRQAGTRTRIDFNLNGQ